MITVNEAFEILRANLPARRQEKINLADAYGRYLADDLAAPESSPRYTNSAMDGYALRWQDVENVSRESQVSLFLAGESRAGEPFAREVRTGEAVRISTGAVLPEGADTVVRLEDTEEQDNSVTIFSARHQGQDVRKAGEEFQAGDLLLAKGSRLKARQLALLASVGIHNIDVFAIPGVALLVTGTELVTIDDKSIKPFQIRDSNTVMLAGAVRETGGKVIQSGRVEDNLEHTGKVLEKTAGEGPDFILCSGGVSVGRHDHVKKAAEAAGFSELLWKIRQKPGKPLFVARRENVLLFGLPGNPVSAYMCFHHYVSPMMAYMNGQAMAHQTITAGTSESIVNQGKRTIFLRVGIEFVAGEVPMITEVKKQGSHMLSSISNADGYIVLEAGETIGRGSLKETYLF